MPSFSIFGWQRPCYLLQDGYTESYKELMETTKWEDYGVPSGNPKCANCMVSCGYEAPAVIEGFGTLKGFWGMVKGTFSTYKDDHALKMLNEWKQEDDAALVQIEKPATALEETNA
jgi:hypothetical protein